MSKRRRPPAEDYAVGWICALPIEFAAATEMLDETYDDFENGGSSRYNLGRINEHNVVVACLPKGRMGTNSAATVAAELKSSFPSIRFVVLVGIGGGVPSADADIRLGDVVVSLPGKKHGGVIQYDFGKSTPNGLERTAFLNAPPTLLLEAVARVQANHIRGQDTRLRDYISHFNRVPAFSSENLGQDVLFDANYRHIEGPTCEKCSKERIVERELRNNDVVIHYGLIASGNLVIKDGAERDRVASELKGVLCYEMEAAGIMNTFQCLVIRGICDYADSHKNEQWQPYAAAMAAAYTKDLLSVTPPAAVVRARTMIEILREKQVIEETLNRLPYALEATFNSYRRQHERTCLVGTRVHVLEEINNWSKKDDNRSIFWLNGWAGTGKSAIAGTVARQYYDEQRLGASFFFSRGGGDIGHAGKFVTTIARQLASNILSLQQFMCDAVASYSIGTESLGDQWRHLILGPLSKMDRGSGQPSYLLVIDALDECDDDKGIQVILRLLTEAQPVFNNILRVLITSRPNLPIEVGFSRIPPANHCAFILHHLPLETISHDIVFFLQHELKTIAQDQALEPAWPGAEAIERLANRASGLFIWSATACRFIREGGFFAEERLISLLQGSTSSTAPEEHLNEIYTSVLRAAILPTYTEQEKEKLYDHLRHVLGTIVILYSPLPLESMCKLIQAPKRRAAKMLVHLHAILDVPDDLTGPLRLHHPSFRDFLIDNHRCRDADFFVDKHKVHHGLSESCLQLMSSTLKHDICDVNAPGTSADDVDETQKQQCLPSEIQYACFYWAQHLQSSNVLLKDGDAIHQFLNEHVLHWLEALSWMRSVSEGIRALLSLESLASKSKCPQVSNLIWDAKRLTRANQSIMEKAPLQIYFSALVFAPSTSPIRNRFSHVPMQWMTKLPTIRTHWSSLQQTLECNPDQVLHITFSPDGNVLASTSGSKVRLWDPSSGQCLNRLEGQYGLETLDDEVFERDFQNAFIAFSPNGETLASASLKSRTVWLWDVLTGQCLQALHGHTRAVNQVAFSCNGDMLASSSYDQTVRLWDPCTGNCLHILTGHTDCVRAVAFSPAPRFANILASLSDDGNVRIWDSTTAKCLQDFKTNDEGLSFLAFSCDGEMLASAYGDKSNMTALDDPSNVQLWNPMTGQSLHILQGHSLKITAIAFSPAGKILASASWDNSVRLWDPLEGYCVAILRHHAPVYDFAFAPDGKTLVSATSHDDDSVWLWDPLTGQRLQKMEGHSSWVHSVAFSPSSNNGENLFASAASDASIILWSRSAEQGQAIAQNKSDIISNFTQSHDGKKLVLSMDKTIHLWDLSTGEQLRTLDGHTNRISLVAILPDGEKMVSTDQNRIHLWDLSTGQRLQTLDCHTRGTGWIPISPDGGEIVLIADGSHVLNWNLSSGERLQTFNARTITSVCFSPDGEKIGLITHDDKILIWNPSNGKGLQPLNTQRRWIQATAFSPDGDKFASLSVDSMLQICDVSTGHWLQTLQACTYDNEFGYAIAFRPDGLYMASSCGEIARLWDLSTGQCLQTLRGHINAIFVMAFSRDGRLLASASGDPFYFYSRSYSDYNSLRLWNPFTGQCIHILDGTPGITSLSFSSDDQYLNTTLGALSLGPVTKSAEENDDTKPQTPGIFIKNTWITWNGQNHFWLPPEYRPKYTAVYGNIVAILTGDHQMTLFNFSLH